MPFYVQKLFKEILSGSCQCQCDNDQKRIQSVTLYTYRSRDPRGFIENTGCVSHEQNLNNVLMKEVEVKFNHV